MLYKDRWGEYRVLSGNESPDTCFWCGKPCKNRYCSDECRIEYYRNFESATARDWCLKRAEYKCQWCGNKPLHYPTSIRVPDYYDVIDELTNINQPIITEQEFKNIVFSYICHKCHGSHAHRIYRKMRDGYNAQHAQEIHAQEIKDYEYSQLEVHHIIPINGGRRDWTTLNRPDNLICLCRKCHNKTKKHKRPDAEMIKDSQPVLF